MDGQLKEKNHQERETKVQIEAAIADAIQFVMAISLKRITRDYSLDELKKRKENLTDLMAYATKNDCLYNSETAATFLVDTYSQLFTDVFIIAAQTDNLKVFKRGDWRWHAGLIVQDILGTWHYITPANSSPRLRGIRWLLQGFRKRTNPVITHEKAGSLDGLLEIIHKLEVKSQKEIWPSTEEIEEQMKRPEILSASHSVVGLPYIAVITKKNLQSGESHIEGRTEALDVQRDFFQSLAKRSFTR